MKKIFVLVTMMIMTGITTVYGSDASSGHAGAFLKIGNHAQAKGMGSAFTAVAGPASSYWNPAGLSKVRRQQVSATYTALPLGGDYSQFNYVLPISSFHFHKSEQSGEVVDYDYAAIGLSLFRFITSYTIEARQTDSLNPDYLFTDNQGMYNIAFGMPLYSDWSVGATVKGLYHLIDRSTAYGWGLDTGVMWTGIPDLTLACMIRDLYSSLSWPSGYNEIFPVTVKTGVAYRIGVMEKQSVLLALDVAKQTSSEPFRLMAGLEYGFYDRLFVRAGYHDGQPALGAGLMLQQFGWGSASLKLDYALEQDKISDWDHWFTLDLLF